MADLKEYFGLSGDQDMAVVINNEMVGDMARLIDGKVYLHVETVYEYTDAATGAVTQCRICDSADRRK